MAQASAGELKELWLARALDRAGIDRSRWHPSVGVEDNRRTIEAVYDYYGRLFSDHPYLLWSGMAGMIGPAFYAGFMDIGWLPDAARRAIIALAGRASRRLHTWAAGDLGFYETTFLTMQKKIFEDQAPMHEAYLAEGLTEIERFYRARIIDRAMFVAWQRIDRGRGEAGATLLDSGNRALLWREQRDIIDRFYVQMLGHRRPEGAVITYLMTLTGAPSVPGAHSYPELFPLVVMARLPRALLTISTPLARGNIAVFANRWGLIERDTLPDYLRFVRDHPDQASALVQIPAGQRARSYRLLVRGGKLALAAVTRWRLTMSTAPPAQAATGPAARPRQARGDAKAVLDLTNPPSRESWGFASGDSSRLWMAAGRASLDATVLLPGGRAYRAFAQIVAAFASTFDGDPDQVTVQHPPSDLDATERLLRQYATQWSFPETAVADWRKDLDGAPSGDHEYSTHVFTPEEVGFVHLEFQVAHHVRQSAFVLATLFTW